VGPDPVFCTPIPNCNCSQLPALVVAQEDSLLPQLLSEDPILRYEVLDGVLLSAIDPSRKDQE
jgi:hypothetical protein